MAPDGALAYREWDRVDVDPRAVDEFPRKMTALVEQHRPSRMPFFRRVAALLDQRGHLARELEIGRAHV